ncbi:MAG: gliding motility-associated C-terminal domain-containing protein [Saprospiraceae bacterium]|nr:gliding motility-associated C-terminal domain-containing protein [Saprospiraceae bacterium]
MDFSDPTAVDVNGLAPGLYEIFYEVTDPICNTDITTIQFDILAFPNAGSGLISNACTGVPDSTDLTTLLMPPFDVGGRWESFTDPGIQISSTSNVMMGNSSPGTYEFYYIVDLPICGSDTATVMIDVLQSPDAGTDNSIASCGGDIDISALHGGVTGGTYDVSPTAMLDFSDPSFVDISGLEPGDYQVMYLVQDGTCPSDTSLITVTKERVPNAGTGSNLAICEGSQDSLILNSLIGGTYDNDGTWMDMSGNGITIEANSEIDLTSLPGGSYSFRYLVTSPACGSDSSDFIVDIISNPFAGRDTTDMICGGIVDLRAYFPGSNVGGTYTINPTQSIDFSDPQAVDFTSLSDGNYLIVYSINAPGCPAVSAELSLDIVSPPVAGLDTTLLRCDDPIITFDQVLRGHDPGGRVIQDKKQYAVSEMINLDTIADPTFLYIVDGNASCPADTAILVLESDVFLSAGNNVNITDCDGQSIDLMAELDGADPGGLFIDVNGEVLPTTVVTIGPGNTAVFQYVTSTLCGVDSALITINNIQYSNFSLVVSDGSPCQDDCVDISVDMSGPESLQFYYSIVDDTGIKIDSSIILNGQVSSIIQMCVVEGATLSSTVLGEDQVYTLTVDSLIYNNRCAVPYDLGPVEIRSLGNRYGVLDTLVCVGESFTKGSIFFSETNPSDIVVMAGMASNFCDSILTVNVAFEDAIFGILDTMICRGDNITINGRIYSENLTFGQDTFPGASSAGCDSILMVQVGILDPVMGVFSASVCDRDSVLIIGDKSFTIDDASGMAVISGGASNGCDSLVDVSISYLNTAMSSYDTIVCDAGFNFAIDGEVFSIDRNEGQLVYPGAAANGCDSILNISITYDLLDVSYEILPLVCPDDEEWGITLMGTDGSLPLSYEIAGQAGEVSSFPFIISLDINDDRVVSFRDAIGCNGTDSIDLVIPGEIAFEIEAVSIGANSYQLSLDTDADISIVEWNPGIGLSCIDCPEPTAMINGDINYEVNVITSMGCALSDTITLRAESASLIFIPNAFSPNDDGINDIWYVTVGNFADVSIESITMFDRWGNIVYQPDQIIVNSPQDGWDGRYRSKKLNSGVYVYQVVYEDEEGNRKIIRGDLTIIQ